MMHGQQPMMHGQQPMMHGQQPVIQGQDQMMHGHHGQSHIAQEPVAPQPMNYANMAPLVESSDELGAHDSTDTAADSGDQGELTQLRAEIAELRALVSGAKKPPALPVEVEDIAATDQSEIGETLTGLEKRMGDLVDLIHKTQAPHNLDSAGVLMDRLRHIGVGSVHAEELASRVLRSVPGGTSDDGDVLAMLEQCIADDLMCGGAILPNDDRRRVLAFVGPTGVGKTTTIAKVASQARLAGKRVALITVDTCRAAAVEQLARYADVLNAPLKVVKDPAHLTDALDEFAAYDVVLVDTNGRNPRAHDDVSALRDFFPTDWGGELVLTLACSTRESDLHTAVDAFGALGIALVCITKTDETRDLGVVYSLARRACRPVAWTTHGRTIPDDIEIAESLTWSRTLVSEISHRAATAEAS
jgi:signal recognition particle GTPase